MRNWYEMEAYGRERAADLSRLAASIRMEREAVRAGRRPYRIACVAGRLWATMDGSTAGLHGALSATLAG